MAILRGTEEPHDPVCFRPDGRRLDGRAVDELRPFECEVGVIKNAQGSALVRHGGNQIYAVVYGPREVHPRHLAKPDRGILRVYYRMCTFSVYERKSPAPNRRENEISKVIREALEPVLFLEAYPDSQIEIYIEVVAADGGTRCASTTAASLALADAGIPMRSMVVGVAAGKAEGKVLLDLGDKEDKVGQADVPAVVIMKTKDISLLQFDGEMSVDEMKTGFQYILKGAEEIYQKQMNALRGKYEDIQEQAELEDDIIKQAQGDELEASTDIESAEISSNPESDEDEEATPEDFIHNDDPFASQEDDTSSEEDQPVSSGDGSEEEEEGEPGSQISALSFNDEEGDEEANLDDEDIDEELEEDIVESLEEDESDDFDEEDPAANPKNPEENDSNPENSKDDIPSDPNQGGMN